MDINRIDRCLKHFNPHLVRAVLGIAKKIPYFRRKINSLIRTERNSMMKSLDAALKPYRGMFPEYASLPERGSPKSAILNVMRQIKKREEAKWRDGFVSGAVYHGDRAHIDFLNEAYAINSQANPLQSDVWPSINKYEAEIVSMTAAMLGSAGAGGDSPRICGTVTSGGTESILLAMKAYRDRAREEKGIRKPEMIAPVTVHAAFDKAAQYFNIKLIKVPVDANFRADAAAVRRAITGRTIVIIGSAPSFPHGMIDPIEEISELARARGIGFHTDACLGGFILPWLERLGHPIPPFDFRLPGVTSMSADTHKYGYAAKGTSVVLYRDPELRHYQFYKTAEWPGGLYLSPTLAGSRPGALSAACWAAMVSLGEKGYIDAARKIMETAAKLKKGIAKIPGLHILGDPLWVIAFGSREFDIYRVMDRMSHGGWSLNGLHKPSCVHICVTLRHARPGFAERFLRDLKSAVAYVRVHPGDKNGMAPMYGMAATFPDSGMVEDVLDAYLDALYRI